MAATSQSFRDFDLTFRKNPITKDVNTLTNENAIKEAVKNIVRYNFYEKPFLPNFGGNTIAMLFELYEAGSASAIEAQIQNCVNNYEPRVVCYDVEAQFNEDVNELSIIIRYLITGLPNVIDQIDVIFRR
jgi:phage baseplate assembly protein W